ncbi:MAG: hypothetical protein EXS55_00555 [Candidatus Magasanikbacteria bacterium]|nr:hypothetical protein [Candidatus Magasanikbacteria bacterium]
MKVKVYLFPGYVSLESIDAAMSSQNLLQFLSDRGVMLDEQHWGGTIDSLPKKDWSEGPVMVRASSRMDCAREKLAQVCADNGWFCFYRDEHILADGTADHAVVRAVEAFLLRHGL